jgi:hypothetical protein
VVHRPPALFSLVPPECADMGSHIIKPEAGWVLEDLHVRILDGDPPSGFDCGREEQNRFLYERASRDHQAQVSVTHIFFIKGLFAAYATIMMDSLTLYRRERGKGVHYQSISALKLAQLGVDKRFQGSGWGGYWLAM